MAKPKKPVPRWLGVFPSGDKAVAIEYTKSEARASLKAMFGIPRKGRLPVGTVIQKIATF